SHWTRPPTAPQRPCDENGTSCDTVENVTAGWAAKEGALSSRRWRSYRDPRAEIILCGAFANWRAARATGDRNLNTFRVRAEAAEAAADLQPGMTVWLKPASRSCPVRLLFLPPARAN